MSTIYLAARYSRRLELCGYRTQLEELGYSIPARWLLGSHQIDNEGRPLGEDGEVRIESPETPAPLRERFAMDDLQDVLAADILVAFTDAPRTSNSRGGRHVELGIALGAGIPVMIVGPRENIFCHLPHVRAFYTWSSCRAVLAASRARLV